MIASPDVHVDEARYQIGMHFHCGERASGNMTSFVAISPNTSRDGVSGFVKGPTLFASNMRHSALAQTGPKQLSVFFTNVGEDPPERILMTTVE